MWVRKRIEIRPRELLWGMSQCVLPTQRDRMIDAIARVWRADDLFVCLSVRSGFDLFLQRMDWPAESEIIMSGLTIPDMPKIVREHGYVPRGVDVSLDTFAPSVEQVRAQINPRTKAIVIAHLFGGLCDISPIVDLARQHNLLILEDCAQAYVGCGYQGDPRADISMFSFGPIKTNTALGGAVFRIRQPDILRGLTEAHREWPVQSRNLYFRRLLKYSSVKLMSTRLVAGSISGGMRLFGGDHDGLATRLARGFAGANFFRRIRRQPATPLLNLLLRKLERFDPSFISRRQERGFQLMDMLGDNFKVLGSEMDRPTFWVFPILVENPQEVVPRLWRAGFDGTASSSLKPVSGQADEADPNLKNCKYLLRHMVFLPFDQRIPDRELARMAEILRQLDPPVPAPPRRSPIDSPPALPIPPQPAETAAG